MSVLLSGSEVFSLAIDIETSGSAFYRTVASAAEDGALADLFGFLAAEETRHLQFFRSLLREVGEITLDGEAWEETSRYIRATTEGRFFVGENRAILAARGAGSAGEAIEIAIGFEKDTLLFFHELLQITPAASREAARRIVEEEKRHILMLSERRGTLPV